ncbi:cytochrome c biogenesis CcdA family protein [Pyruvatibacter mobilis]|uniref:cytochrome c biogenesis CcdA family protein n=1 Tax=Pyruvatibacter mobilis TaxID=1712261 RepID=UPI003BAB22C7
MDTGSISYFAAFLGGLISFLSPCVLPLVPAYLSYMAGTTFEALSSEDEDVTRRALVGSFGFVLGFSTVFVALGATASAISPLILANKVVIGYVAGSVIIILGLHYMGLLRIRLLDREMRLMPATLGPSGSDDASPSPVMQALAPYGIGLAFGFGWTPCIGPILATILSIAASRDDLGYGVSLLSVYSMGLGLPFILAALGIRSFLAFSARFKRHMHKVEIAAGVLLVGTGLLIFFGSLETIAYWLIDAFPGLAKLG